jgi:hypothetical protein
MTIMRSLFLSFVAVLLLPAFVVNTPAEDTAVSRLFPFVVPGDDVSGGVTDMSFLNDRPADQLVTVRDGRFYAGDKRIRFWGMNNDYEANYPTHKQAEILAKRFAKLGMNILRITHTDQQYAPRGLFDPAFKGEMRIDPAQMERLDYFIAELKKRGIYVELSLNVDHLKMMGKKGIPDVGGRRYGFGAGFPLWNARFIEAEKQYARDFFCHVNPYTGKPYTEESAVAFVEILNENGILCAWPRGHLKGLWSDALVADFQSAWNAYLRKRYQTTDALRQAWAERAKVDGGEVLQNPKFAKGTEGWALECVSPSTGALKALKDGYEGKPCVVATCDRESDQTWHVNLYQTGLNIEKDCVYQLSFAAKADKPLKPRVSLTKGYRPWSNIGLSMQPNLTEQWQKFSQRFVGHESESRSRMMISFAQTKNRLHFADFSLKKVGVAGLQKDESLETGNIALLLTPADCRERTPQVARDFMDFLYEVDDRYFSTMYTYLKNDLGCQHPIKGTQAASDYSFLFTQAKCDFLDAHGYWKLPRVAGDCKMWTLANVPMVNAFESTVVDLALCRARAKPFNVSEYCHAAPNTYCSEEIPTVTSFAAFQDWDGVMLFTYTLRDHGNNDMIPDFFEHKNHPTKLVTMPFGALAFRRSDVAPAKEAVSVGITLGSLKQYALRHAEKDNLIRNESFAADKGATWRDAFTHRLSLALGSETIPKFQPAEQAVAVSDTGELTYDVTKRDAGVLIVNSARSKAVIGFGAGKTFDLGDCLLKPGPTMQNGFSVITASVVSGNEFHSAGATILLTATGYVEYVGIGWNADKSSVGGQWGKGPVLCEGIPFELILKTKGAKAWALDPRGQRAGKVVPRLTSDGLALRLGPHFKTLWYEVVIE